MTNRFWDALNLDERAVYRLPEWLRSWIAIGAGVYFATLILCLIVVSILPVRLSLDALSPPPSNPQETIRNFLLAFASAFGGPFLVWRAIVAHRQAIAAGDQARVALENHVTGIFSKAVELIGLMRQGESPLGDGAITIRSMPNIESRLGGIYSLERLLHESAKDRRAILETLCAYIRENSPITYPDREPDVSAFLRGEIPPTATQRKDVQAAITVIGRRPSKPLINLDFKMTNLIAYDFSKHNFDHADFTGSFLNGAKMAGASFANSVFSHAFMCQAEMHGTSFQFSTFDDCHFNGAKIDETSFKSTVLINTDLRSAKVKSIQLEDANLEGAFGYGLQFAVENIHGDGLAYLNGQEILSLYQLFQKATCNENTRLSKFAHEAIKLMKQNAEKSPSDTT